MDRHPADGLAPVRRASEGLYKCQQCGGVVVRARDGRKCTPMGEQHVCEVWQVLRQQAMAICGQGAEAHG